MRSRLGSLGLLAVIVGASTVASAPAAAWEPVPPVTSTVCEADRVPLPEGLASELAARYPGRRFSAAVVDSHGCTYDLHPERRMTTASVLKIEVMVGVLLRAQQQGRGLTQHERDRIWPMITESADPPTTQLWSSLGGAPGMEALDEELGLTDTVHASPLWGLTSTSAADQARFVHRLWTGQGSPLHDAMRAEARYYLTNVVPSQRWGATAGVPGGWTVGQKNGFFASQAFGWRLNTAGWVERPDGSGWAVVVLSDGWATEAEGIAAVHELTGRINVGMREPSFSGPGAVVDPSNRLDVFSRRPLGDVLQQHGMHGSPLAGTAAGGRVSSDLDGVAASSPGQAPEAVGRGVDGAAWRWRWFGSAWGHERLGGTCSSGPTATYTGTGRYDVFCRGSDGQLWWRWWTPSTGWSGWSGIGGRLSSDPDTATPGPGGFPSVVGRGLDGALWQYVPGPSGWHLHSLGGVCTSGPTAAHSGPTRADVFCRGGDGQLWTRSWTLAGGWGGWQPLGGQVASDPDASSAGVGGPRVVAVRGLDGGLWTYTQVGGGGWAVAAVR